MVLRGLAAIIVPCLLLLHGVDSLSTHPGMIRGSLQVQRLGARTSNVTNNEEKVKEIEKPKEKEKEVAVSRPHHSINLAQVGIGAVIGGMSAVVIVAAMLCIRKFKAEDELADEKSVSLLSPREAKKAPSADYAELLTSLTKKVTENVGPKFQDGGPVRHVLEERFSSFTDKAKNFLLGEMDAAAGAVMREVEADESVLMLDWNHAVESNLPPVEILIAGMLSPTVIDCRAFHHLLQTVTVAVPLFVLCAAAIYIDRSASCSIPSIFWWLCSQTVLSLLLSVGHGFLFSKFISGGKELRARRDQMLANLSGGDGSISQLKERFICNTVLLQEALLIENGARRSIWNNIVGVSTTLWLLTGVWTLVLIAGWTFVPGRVAFHPKAIEVAQAAFCGSWATVVVLRISMLLSVLYFFLNLATVVQWLCDMLISSSKFSDIVLKQARKADKAGGVPVAEMLAKAFLLRGGEDEVISHFAVVQFQKKFLRSQEGKLSEKLAALNREIDSMSREEMALAEKAKGGGDLAAQTRRLSQLGSRIGRGGNLAAESNEFENWKKQGLDAIAEAETKVVEFGMASTESLEKMYARTNEIMEEVKNSQAVQAAAAKAAEAKAAAEELAQQAYDKLNDPEFQAQMRKLAERAKGRVEALGAQAKDMANEAIAMASDPELQRQLQEAAQQAMDQAKAMAEKAAEAANDPELQKKMKETMEQAQAKALEAAATVTDPELQKKMQENAMQALEQIQEGAKSAAAAYIDPELLQQMQDKAMQTVEEARSAAAQAAAAATDPKIREVALAKLQEAHKQAEAAAAACTDPETRKKFEDQAKKAMAQAQEVGAAAAAAAQESAAAAQESAAAAADQASVAAAAAVEEAADKAAEVAEQAKEAAKDVAAKAKATKKSRQKRGN